MTTEKKDDGGSAFPKMDWGNDGMSLRDWFAGQALAGVLSDSENGVPLYSKLAEWAYTIADGMLEQRKKK